jgi:hypothetical protein
VPRELARKEHIDNNQVDFGRVFAADDKLELTQDRDELFMMLDKALDDPTHYRFDPAAQPQAPGIARVAEVVDALVWRLPRSA